mmetsp:Transcript_102408/g.305861  ORF Transcript_102408/g.305861 Transcript_102408/m.305861 type:complete len:304 (+) Transcript_102408:826-1737(+)
MKVSASFNSTGSGSSVRRASTHWSRAPIFAAKRCISSPASPFGIDGACPASSCDRSGTVSGGSCGGAGSGAEWSLSRGVSGREKDEESCPCGGSDKTRVTTAWSSRRRTVSSRRSLICEAFCTVASSDTPRPPPTGVANRSQGGCSASAGRGGNCMSACGRSCRRSAAPAAKFARTPLEEDEAAVEGREGGADEPSTKRGSDEEFLRPTRGEDEVEEAARELPWTLGTASCRLNRPAASSSSEDPTLALEVAGGGTSDSCQPIACSKSSTASRNGPVLARSSGMVGRLSTSLVSIREHSSSNS